MSYTIIIPSKNDVNLYACMKRLREMGERGGVIVVDDGLHDAPADDVTPWMLVNGDKPFIFSRNVNIGIREAGRNDVVLLNDDALLGTWQGFNSLARQIGSHPEYGAVCPGFNLGGCRHTNLVNQQRQHIANEPTMLIFACCYIPRTTIDRVGLLDERFGLNAGGPGARGYGLEDDDYSLRIRQAGLKLGVYDGVIVNHTTLRSTFRHDPEHPADVRMHEELFRQKHGHWPEGHGMAPR